MTDETSIAEDAPAAEDSPVKEPVEDAADAKEEAAPAADTPGEDAAGADAEAKEASPVADAVAAKEEEKAPADDAGGPPKKPKLEAGVNSCFAVVSGAVRKGKGAGRGLKSAAGGYVPAHMKQACGAAEEPPAEAEPVAPASPLVKLDSGDSATAEPGGAGLAGGASFDSNLSLGLSSGGSFDLESGEGGSLKKKAKRWQKRGSQSSTDLTAAVAAAEKAAVPSSSSTSAPAMPKSSASAPAMPKSSAPWLTAPDAKRPRTSPTASPVAEPLDGDALMASPDGLPDDSAGGDMPPPSPFGDAGWPPASPAVDIPPPSPAPTGPITLMTLSASKLKTLARYHGISLAGCLEKPEFVAALRKGGLDDTAAERLIERENSGLGAAAPAAAPTLTENEKKAQDFAAKRAAVKLSEAEARAAAAEEEAKRLRDLLNDSQNADAKKKKWAPAFKSTPFVPGTEDFDMPRGMGAGAGGGGGKGGGKPFGGSHAFKPGVDVRWNGGIFEGGQRGGPGGGGGKGDAGGKAGGPQKGDPEFNICWEFRKGTCTKGAACKWKH